MTDDIASSCQKCGASVYKQHLDSGIARYEGGKLMCAHCCSEYERMHDSTGTSVMSDFESIPLDDDDDGRPSVDMSQSRIMTTEHNLGKASSWDDSTYRRPLVPGSSGATRCRSFHSKLADSALRFLNTQINEWLDADDSIVIKSSSSTIGTFEGKHAEPHLILTVFY